MSESKQKKRKAHGANGRRRANYTGTLERRGGKWLARWYVYDQHGNRIRKSELLKLPDGAGIDAARAALKEKTEGNALITRETIIRKNLDQLDGVAAELRDWEDKQPALAVADAWDVFDSDVSSRTRDPATQTNYGQWFAHFARWLAAKHPEIVELRRVGSAVAREYANELLAGTGEKDLLEIAAAKKRIEALRQEVDPAAKTTGVESGRLLAWSNFKPSAPVRGTTYNRHLNALALVWATLAAKDANGQPIYPTARLGGNPFAWDKRTKTGIQRITLKRGERPHRRRVLSLDEIKLIMDTAQGELKVLVALGFYTGLRLGDCATLDWDHIDRVNGIITTRSHKTDTETDPRIHPTLARIITENVKTRRGYLLPSLADLYNAGTTGRVKIVNMITDLFQSVGIKTSVKESGDARARPDCGFHSLRHTYVTQLERVGATLAERQRLAGHRTAAMTEHYTHDDNSRVLALPDITRENVPPTPEDAAEGRFRAFCEAWQALATPEERKRARAWMAGKAGVRA